MELVCLADFERQLDMCWHAAAVKQFVQADETAELHAGDMYEFIDEVVLQHDTVILINGSTERLTDVVLSVCPDSKGWPRVTVGADHSGCLLCRSPVCANKAGLKYKCKHCKAVSQWLLDIEGSIEQLEQTADSLDRLDMFSALAAQVEGLSLRQLDSGASHDNNSTRTAAAQACPVTISRIDPDAKQSVMQARACGKLGAPSC